jgi:hypothetical protein
LVRRAVCHAYPMVQNHGLMGIQNRVSRYAGLREGSRSSSLPADLVGGDRSSHPARR